MSWTPLIKRESQEQHGRQRARDKLPRIHGHGILHDRPAQRATSEASLTFDIANDDTLSTSSPVRSMGSFVQGRPASSDLEAVSAAAYTYHAFCQEYVIAIEAGLGLAQRILSNNKGSDRHSVETIIQAVLAYCRRVKADQTKMAKRVLTYVTGKQPAELSDFTFLAEIIIAAGPLDAYYHEAAQLVIERVFAEYRKAISCGQEKALVELQSKRKGLQDTVVYCVQMIEEQCQEVRVDMPSLKEVASSLFSPTTSCSLVTPASVRPAQSSTTPPHHRRRSGNAGRNHLRPVEQCSAHTGLILKDNRGRAVETEETALSYGNTQRMASHGSRTASNVTTIDLTGSNDDTSDHELSTTPRGHTRINGLKANGSSGVSRKAETHKLFEGGKISAPHRSDDTATIRSLDDRDGGSELFTAQGNERLSNTLVGDSDDGHGDDYVDRQLIAVRYDAPRESFDSILDKSMILLKRHTKFICLPIQRLLACWTKREIKEQIKMGVSSKMRSMILALHYGDSISEHQIQAHSAVARLEDRLVVGLIAVQWGPGCVKKRRSQDDMDAIDAIYLTCSTNLRRRAKSLLSPQGASVQSTLHSELGVSAKRNTLYVVPLWEQPPANEHKDFFQPRAESGFDKSEDVLDAFATLTKCLFVIICWGWQTSTTFNREMRETFPRSDPRFGLHSDLGVHRVLQFRGRTKIVTSNDGETSAVLERSVARVDYAKRRDRILNSKHGLEATVSGQEGCLGTHLMLGKGHQLYLHFYKDWMKGKDIHPQDKIYVKIVFGKDLSFSRDRTCRGLMISLAKVHKKDELPSLWWQYWFQNSKGEGVRYLQRRFLGGFS